MGFTKLDELILQSSILAESATTFKIWICLLAACRADGIAPVSAVYLSSICHIPIARVDVSLERLESPDPHSRSKVDDGRRIRRVDGGFKVINYEVYRDASLKDAEAERKRLYRQRIKECPDDSGRCPDASASVSVSVSASGNRGKGRGKGGIRLVLDEEPKRWEGIANEDKALWAKTFPGCDIDRVLQEMIAYWDAQPRAALKINWKRTIVNRLKWLQDHSGNRSWGENHPERRPDPPHTGTFIPPTVAEKELEKKLLAEFEQAKKKFMATKGYKTEDDIPFDELETFAMFRARRAREIQQGASHETL